MKENKKNLDLKVKTIFRESPELIYANEKKGIIIEKLKFGLIINKGKDGIEGGKCGKETSDNKETGSFDNVFTNDSVFNF